MSLPSASISFRSVRLLTEARKKRSNGRGENTDEMRHTCYCRVSGLTGRSAGANYPDRNNQPYQDSRNHDRSYRRDQNSNYPDTIPPGTRINVRTNDTIDVRSHADNRIYAGTIAEDVVGENGRVLIPRGANAELIVTNVNNNEESVDLESVTINGHRYMVSADAYDQSRRAGIGKNKRTGEFLGGGAALGAIAGAIAGGGKGAAIGAAAGAGAGAGSQVLARGKTVRIPAESVLTFRLNQPLKLGRRTYATDRGENRNGQRYHDNYYGHNRDENTPPQ
jgi:hypothetical protein